jgi:hypothetical protein
MKMGSTGLTKREFSVPYLGRYSLRSLVHSVVLEDISGRNGCDGMGEFDEVDVGIRGHVV